MKKVYIDKPYLEDLLNKYYLEGYNELLGKRAEFKNDRDRYLSIAYHLADDSNRIGRLYYIIGDFNKAQVCFINSCKYWSEYWHYDPWTYKMTILPGAGGWISAAIYSREENLRIECAKMVIDSENILKENEKKKPLLNNCLSICQYLLNDYNEATKYFSLIAEGELIESRDNSIRGESKFIGHAIMLDGLFTKNKEKILDGLIVCLKKYKNSRRGEPIPFSVDAMNILILAKEKGIIIKKEDIPDNLHRPIFRFFEDPY